ncbi:MAG TPA: hypothetical protein VHE37_11085, partial [Nevskiaceae bacterium]|nr:hypothetical protein [Nevskiaceae bacterium]
QFKYGTHGSLPGPEPVGTFTDLGDLDASSNYTTDGVITLVLDTTAIGLKPGDVLSSISASTRLAVPDAAEGAGLTQDSAGSALNYTLIDNAVCKADLAGGGGVPVSSGGGAASGASADNGRFGGALGGLLLAPFAFAAMARRRRGRSL